MILLKNRDRNPSFKSGKYIELNDAGNYPMELSIDGVCEQETTTGKNLLDYVSNLITSANGLTNVINEDGSITTTGKPTSNYSTIIKTIDITDILEDKSTYTISQTVPANLFVQINMRKLDGTLKYINSNRGSSSFIVDKSIYRSYILIIQTTSMETWGDSSLTITNKYMLCKGTDTADTSFEPYTGGQPSPSPDYPQEIKTIENSLKITSCNKNLYFNDKEIHKFTSTKSRWKFLDGNDGADTSDSSKTLYKAKVKKGKTYTFTTNIKASEIVPTSLMYDDNTSVTNMNGTDLKYNYTFISKKDCYVLLRMYVNSGISVEVSNVMLVEGSNVPFEQHLETQITANLPEGEFIGKINDTYKDTLNVVYKDDGHYHLILNKMIGKVVLDGSENISLISTAKKNTNLFAFNSIVSKDETFKEKSNRFQTGKSFYMLDEEGLYITTSGIRIRIKKTTANSLNDFKSWLSTHNLEVYYALATPYELDLGIVDTLLSYDEVTNVFSDSDLYPVINVKYYKDFKFDKILRSGYNIDEQEYEIAKKQMANGKRKRILSSYVDCIIKINLGLLDNKTYQEYKEQLDDGEFHYWSYKYNQYKKANFILTKPSITTEYAYNDDIGINDMEITLEKSSDIE